VEAANVTKCIPKAVPLPLQDLDIGLQLEVEFIDEIVTVFLQLLEPVHNVKVVLIVRQRSKGVQN